MTLIAIAPSDGPLRLHLVGDSASMMLECVPGFGSDPMVDGYSIEQWLSQSPNHRQPRGAAAGT